MAKKTFSLLITLIFSLAIAGFNFWLVFPWFSGDGPANLGSIEVSYVTMSRWLVENWPNLSWNPVWYLGFPFSVFYTPVLPVLVAILKILSGFTFWHAYRVVTGLGLVLAPVSLFFFVSYLSRNKFLGLVSAVLYSILPSLFYFILPSGEVRQDQFGGALFDPRRLVLLARWGEGPHIFSLIFLPLAGLFFFKSLREKSPLSVVLAAFFIGLTALTNAVGLYGLVFLLGAIFLVRVFFETKPKGEAFPKTILIAFLTYGLIAFWYNLSFIETFFGESGSVVQHWINMFPWGWLVVIVGILGIVWGLRKMVKDEGLSAIFLWTLWLIAIVAYYYFSAPAELWQERVELAPQALRYMVEVDMGLAALVGLFLGFIAEKISSKNQWLGRILIYVLGGVIGGGALLYGLNYAPTGWRAMGAVSDPERTKEKQIAQYLSSRLDSQKGERMFLAGNYAFYLNYFTDIWQLRGGLYQAKTHPWPEHIYYQLRMGKDPEIALAWMEAINAKYVLVDPSGEIEQKKKFMTMDLLETLEEGTQVYEVPLTNTSPVKIVNLGGLRSRRIPKKADDKQAVLEYAFWLKEIKEQERVTFARLNNNRYQIKAQLGSNQGILVQMTADKGWRATSTQGRIEIKKDPLGYFVLVPPQAGEYEIILTHGKTFSIWLGYLISFLTLVGVILLLFLRIKTPQDI